MAKFTLEIEIDNDAFGDEPEHEIARILKEFATAIHTYGIASKHSLRDLNGNTVGNTRLIQ